MILSGVRSTILYCDSFIEYGSQLEEQLHYNSRVILCRPVIEDHIDFSFHGYDYDEKITNETKVLDYFYYIKQQIEIGFSDNLEIEDILQRYIGYKYYESECSNAIEITVLCDIIKLLGINLELDLYPNGKNWYKFKDFMESTEV